MRTNYEKRYEYTKKRMHKHIAYGLRRMASPHGSMLVSILVITGLLVTLGMLALQFIITQNNATNQRVDRERALQIAEAGVEYYRWHLAHVPDDFEDGTGAAGPYVHNYEDVSGNVIGTFSLSITPPPSGSTVVTIQSVGQLTNKPGSKRTVTIRQGIPSFTQWAVVANADMRFGVGTEVFGPIHSNGGIRFDGLAHNLVTSYRSTYDDPDHSGNDEYAVHTHDTDTGAGSTINDTFRALEAPPNPVPARPDVFEAGRQFPVPRVDFNAITVDLQNMKTLALANGIHLLPSGGQGYHVTFRTDGKVDMRVVNTQLRCQYNSGGNWRDYGYCSNNFNRSCTQTSNCNYCSGNGNLTCTTNLNCSSQGAGTCITNGFSCTQSSHSIGSRDTDQSTFTYNSGSSLGVDLPTNGIIFIEDDVWVDGSVNNSRVTLVAAREPLASGNANIFVTNDLTYTAPYDGTDAIGLIAQNNILAGFFSENDLRIDAALIAQNGRVGRPYYGAGFTSSTNNANFQLSPTVGYCQNSVNQVCTVNSNCPSGSNRVCLFSPLRGYCSNNVNRACATTANCVNPGTCIISANPAGTSTCQEYRGRTQLTAFGSIATNQRYGFAWTGFNLFNCGSSWNNSGYCTRDLIFDSNLTFAPPPSFPTTGQYDILSWEEE